MNITCPVLSFQNRIPSHQQNKIGLPDLVLLTSHFIFLFSIVNSYFSSSYYLLDYSITGSLFSVLHCAVSEAKEEKDHEGYVL